MLGENPKHTTGEHEHIEIVFLRKTRITPLKL